ncbi:glutamyl-tRNA amidotransferase-like protein subunit A [Bisporella sp. PMI_857]|nr:glutamyl-tRNA amidotransferase-like protein subunit A [Bisporella sp. PMI_857]
MMTLLNTIKQATRPGEAKPGWQDVAKRVRARIDDTIPPSYLVDEALLPKTIDEPVLDLPARSGKLSARELEITELNAHELVPKIADKTYSSAEVTIAFSKRAAIAHQITNCLALILFEEALARAKELDEHLERTGEVVGPLHGLPISVKEHIELKDTPASAGFIAWADDVAKEDALIIRVLREAGAVFHVKTTNPQALMAIETDSNIYGRTTNPYNRALTPGGSSGGEGALIAMRGSPLGIGTDMGGSIRVPAGYNGVYGLKPAIARNPHGGLAGNYGGMENIIGVVGPMANHVNDLRLFQTAALANEPWNYEPTIVRMPWGPSPDLPSKLKVGIIWNDGVVQPHPPVTRALELVKEKLEKAGHEVISWDTSIHDSVQNTLWQMFFLDAAKEVEDVFHDGGEEPVGCIKTALKGGPYGTPKAYTVPETFKINKTREKQQLAYAKQWNETGCDFLISPVNPCAATAHDETWWDGYTGVFNALDHSACSFPVTFVQPTDTYSNYPLRSSTPLGPKDQFYIDKYTKPGYTAAGYRGDGKVGPEKYKNAPVALQAVTRRHTEEKLLSVVELIRGLLDSDDGQ